MRRISKTLLPPALVLVLSAACSRAEALPTLQLTMDGKKTQVSLDRASAAVTPERLVTKPPAYKGATKSYVGLDLGALLKKQGATLTDDQLVTFVCNDGFRSRMSASMLKKGKAVLAWGEVDANEKVAPLANVTLSSGKVVDPGPLYVVWEEAATELTYPNGWPFGVVGIELEKGKNPLDRIDPNLLAGDDDAKRGYAVFARICISCHTVNGIGGAIGPELNQPVNVTEYFAEPFLQRYIRDWTQVRKPRGDERMPRLIDMVSVDDAEAVVRYLRFMKQHK